MKWFDILRRSSSTNERNVTTSSVNKPPSPIKIEAKTYITIFEFEPRIEFDIMNFFKGNIDKVLSDAQWSTYDNLYDLFEKTKADSYGKVNNSVYILESPYSEEEVKEFAAQGLFSKAVSRAYSYHEAARLGGEKAIKENHIKTFSNTNFDANLDVHKKLQHSTTSPRLSGHA